MIKKPICESCVLPFTGKNRVRRSLREPNTCSWCYKEQEKRRKHGNESIERYAVLGKGIYIAEKEIYRLMSEFLNRFQLLEITPEGDIIGHNKGIVYNANMDIRIRITYDKTEVTLNQLRKEDDYISVLEDVAKVFAGKTIDNIIQQLKSIRKETEK